MTSQQEHRLFIYCRFIVNLFYELSVFPNSAFQTLIIHWFVFAHVIMCVCVCACVHAYAHLSMICSQEELFKIMHTILVNGETRDAAMSYLMAGVQRNQKRSQIQVGGS